MPNVGHEVKVSLDAVDEALLGALAAKLGLPPDQAAEALLSGAIQRVSDAVLASQEQPGGAHDAAH